MERVSEKLPSGALIRKDAAGRHKVSPGLASQMKWAMVQASWSSRKEQSMVLKKGEALASLKLLYRLAAPFPGPVTKTLQRVFSAHGLQPFPHPFSAHGFQPFPHPCASGGEANGFSLNKLAAHVIVIYDSHIKTIIADFDSIEH